MEKQFIPYNLALKLKELGFDEPCFGYYDESGKLKQFPNADVFWNKNSKISYNRSIRFMFQEKKAAALLCTAPLWQQAVDWFREKYNYNASVYPLTSKFSSQVYDIFRGCYITKIDLYKTYEEAELECLKQLIEIVKKK